MGEKRGKHAKFQRKKIVEHDFDFKRFFLSLPLNSLGFGTFPACLSTHLSLLLVCVVKLSTIGFELPTFRTFSFSSSSSSPSFVPSPVLVRRTSFVTQAKERREGNYSDFRKPK